MLQEQYTGFHQLILFRECLHPTLDRLKNEPSGHALNANIGDILEELENLIHESEGAEAAGSNHGNGGGGVTINNRCRDSWIVGQMDDDKNIIDLQINK